MNDELTYLEVSVSRPRVGFFELASCEGCQLQLLNNEDKLLDFLNLLEIVEFREAMSEPSGDYQIAFVEGSVSTREDIEHLQTIREKAATLVAFGSCSCFGGVNQLRNRFMNRDWPYQQVYGTGTLPISPLPEVLPLSAVVQVDVEIYGCPVNKDEVERIITDLVVGKPVRHPKYPVCMECTAHGYVCLFDLDEVCLGPVTRGGCDAWCPAGGTGCYGCRGPAEVTNLEQLLTSVLEKGIPVETLLDRLECFGGFHKWADRLRRENHFPDTSQE
ncbi:NADH:ubiquinone oxidoreductase [Desulfopila sp. IMCC35008]|uniref:NADH-quinone oxidoreductase subunit B family protein n=1 Tax=Desulfopila sp. IMCC35008 TaxID=2653858 RepID=UPI0013D5CC4F|nr:NADH:ubiquinone oxidoreductase [Desulfopila sp. IMCC35008]